MAKKIWIKGMEVLVPDNWEELTIKLKDIKWSMGINSSITIRGAVTLSRAIMKVFDPKIQIDHINGDQLNNDTSNLRSCTKHENQHNRKKQSNCTSEFIGVYHDKSVGAYRAQVSINNKTIPLGKYKILLDAVHAADLGRFKYHKEFASTNFPRKYYEDLGLLPKN